MISEELLMEVNGQNTLEYNGYNIYELANKCKMWALDQGYEIYSAGQRKNSPTYWKGPWIATIGNKTWSAKLEYNAILNACEWILANKNTKGE